MYLIIYDMYKDGLPPKKQFKDCKHGSLKVVYTAIQQIKLLLINNSSSILIRKLT